MRTPTPTILLALAALVSAHGDHGDQVSGDSDATYAEMHMASEVRLAPGRPHGPTDTWTLALQHHLDNFDIQAFFHLHDLNRSVSPFRTRLPESPGLTLTARDGILDVNELESIYGVHHEKRRKESGSEEVHTEKAKEIVKTVLATLDTNGDGVLTMREFVAGGVGGLPNFKGVEHLGHHYGPSWIRASSVWRGVLMCPLVYRRRGRVLLAVGTVAFVPGEVC